MRVDYHSTAKPGSFTAIGKIIRVGRTIASAEANVFSTENKLVSSGRATFLVAG